MRFLPFFAALAMLLLPIHAHALQSEVQKAEFSSSKLLVGSKQETMVQAAVEVQLTDGWKTYWRSPGDAGFPFLIEPLATATNVASVELHWPYPKRFVEEWDLEVFGFKHSLTVPVTITLKDTAADTQADFSISYAVCSDICINEQQELSLLIPAGFATDSDSAAVTKALATLPDASGEAGLTIVSAAIDTETKEAGVLAVQVTSDSAIREADLFIESDVAGLRFPKPELVLDEGNKSGAFLVPYEISLPAKTLGGTDVRATFVSDGKAAERMMQIAKTEKTAIPAATEPAPSAAERLADAAPAPATDDTTSLGAMLLLALLGGLILNIMPCVLPVLSIKLLGAVKHGGRNSREVRQSFLASTAGILAFFLLLAGLTIAAKHAGNAVGWGFHFQSPEFLTFLTVLILLFAANMLGWFEIRLPDWLNTHIYDVTDTGALKHRHHLLGDFLTGAFAALMATPCTAPFLGTAIGFALARGETEIVAIFFMLGLGLALPYLAAALVPSLATRLPKPGAWMMRVKQVMGVLLLATALWLLWVIAGQTHVAIAVGLLLLSALLGAVLHGGGRWRFLRRTGSVTAIALGLLVALALLPSLRLSEHQDGRASAETTALWQPFDRAAIAPLVSEGKVVFVDVTADWCLTCKFNKLRALDREAVQAALGGGNVVAMRADMSKPNPDIQAYLREYGRFGIPFNIVYGPSAPQGEPLPELLTPDAVLNAIDAAR